MPGGKKGQPGPASDKGVKMFELAQFNIFNPDVKKAGAGHFPFVCMCWQAMGLGGMQSVGRTWEWSPTWSELTAVEGFDPSAANRGAYAEFVHGIASDPKAKPKTPAAPRNRRTPQSHPANPRDTFCPTFDTQGTVCCVHFSVDLRGLLALI